ncbi:MAG: hypothetical protein AVDCRST_MAG23-165 [uncultured Sphingosinicella sp.]|uniref:Ice-binding protein C-terminal domain-containing protein n=1 Tax=uncultured Sphingosinicella sp. TaxID=478748 RepID=A0A6J4TDH2_9SPHN|nr:PEPxxWA-CTERM sorting domain-containing protein [uncultured Sphingosinicella sp.]CAA9520511.1 MAG: hypothetical protein AVDCRST_MAG23-165 [uncultured Sphingosinicella sp.]
MFNIGDGDLGPSLTFTFGSAITAFGFDWTDLDISDSYRVDFSGPGFTSVGFSTPPFSLNGEGAGFFGFRSDTAFTTVMFTQNAAGGFVDAFGIDNIRTSSSLSAPAVPEPTTWAMMILGFGAAGLSLRRAANVRVASQAA